jgi:hypothetical protein
MKIPEYILNEILKTQLNQGILNILPINHLIRTLQIYYKYKDVRYYSHPYTGIVAIEWIENKSYIRYVQNLHQNNKNEFSLEEWIDEEPLILNTHTKNWMKLMISVLDTKEKSPNIQT